MKVRSTTLLLPALLLFCANFAQGSDSSMEDPKNTLPIADLESVKPAEPTFLTNTSFPKTDDAIDIPSLQREERSGCCHCSECCDNCCSCCTKDCWGKVCGGICCVLFCCCKYSCKFLGAVLEGLADD